MSSERLDRMEDNQTLKKNSKLKRRKKESRLHKKIAKKSKKLRGIKAKIFHKERYKEKVNIKKAIKAHQEKDATTKAKKNKDVPVPAFLMDRETTNSHKVLSNMVK